MSKIVKLYPILLVCLLWEAVTRFGLVDPVFLPPLSDALRDMAMNAPLFAQDALINIATSRDADEDDEALSPAMANVDMVSLDEVADAENELPDIDDDGLVEIDDDDAPLKESDETFIEDEDDSGDDVSGLLGGSRDEEDEI